MHREDDTPLSKEELALAEKGEALVAAAVSSTEAPQSLREAIERERTRAQGARPVPFWRRRRRVLAAAAVAAAVLAVAAVALQSGGGDRAEPSLASVEAAAQAGATASAPASAPENGQPPTLAASVGDLDFPDWQQSFGWKASGRRQDNLSGREVTTVYYRNPDGAELGYAIVSGEALEESPGGHRITRQGNDYILTRGDDHTVVTWEQEGHTCVIVASSAVPASKIVDLAASRNA